MKKILLLIPAFATTFALGFAFNSITTKTINRQQPIKKVTGIGGIFLSVKTKKNEGMVSNQSWFKC